MTGSVHVHSSRWGLLLALAVGAVLGAAIHRLTLPGPVERATIPDVFETARHSVLRITVATPDPRLGTGVAVSETEIVTARHLVFDTVGPIEVSDALGKVQTAEVVGTDARTDLALLRVPGGLSPASLESSASVRVGDTVLAVGNPFGLGHSLSVGVVAGMGRRLDRQSGPRVGFIQLSIPLNPGNSGGPIFDHTGAVVGLLTGTHTQGQAIAFAVPAEVVSRSLTSLRTGKQVSRAFLGVRLEREGGAVRVRSVIPAGPADQAGLRPGDLLSSFDGVTLGVPADLYTRLDSLPGGSRTSVRLLRDGQLHVLEVELADWAQQPVVIAGMTLRPLAGSGGEVVAVRPRSRADKAGVRVDDVVHTVGGLPMRAPADVKDALTGVQGVQLVLARAGTKVSAQL